MSGIADIPGNSSTRSSKSRGHKRKTKADVNEASSSKAEDSKLKALKVTELDENGDENIGAPSKLKKKKKACGDADGERRLRRFREQAPQSKAYQDVYIRATTQRMFVIDRVRGGSDESPKETLSIAGSTGNVYTITISQVPSCNCPHAQKGNQCKHILFSLARVLKAPENLQYQLAFLNSELREIFNKAPPIVPVDASKADSNRKPVDADDTCPICYMEFEDGFKDTVYCKAACGNNIHRECFEKWAASRQASLAPVTCPFCRTQWTGDEEFIKKVAAGGVVNAEGYVNVAAELGISGQRDYSTYHSFWVRTQARNGVNVGDWVDDS